MGIAGGRKASCSRTDHDWTMIMMIVNSYVCSCECGSGRTSSFASKQMFAAVHTMRTRSGYPKHEGRISMDGCVADTTCRTKAVHLQKVGERRSDSDSTDRVAVGSGGGRARARARERRGAATPASSRVMLFRGWLTTAANSSPRRTRSHNARNVHATHATHGRLHHGLSQGLTHLLVDHDGARVGHAHVRLARHQDEDLLERALRQ
jgi:hypothetical protein